MESSSGTVDGSRAAEEQQPSFSEFTKPDEHHINLCGAKLYDPHTHLLPQQEPRDRGPRIPSSGWLPATNRAWSHSGGGRSSRSRDFLPDPQRETGRGCRETLPRRSSWESGVPDPEGPFSTRCPCADPGQKRPRRLPSPTRRRSLTRPFPREVHPRGDPSSSRRPTTPRPTESAPSGRGATASAFPGDPPPPAEAP